MGIFLLVIFLLCIFYLILSACDEEQRKKENKEYKKNLAKNNIAHEFESISNCVIFDEYIIPNLESYLRCLDKIKTDENIAEHIKPYDEYHEGKIKRHLGYASIIIDTNGEPRLAPKWIDLREGNEYRDDEISACLNKEQLEAFIKQCKKIKVNYDIEAFRKNKVEEGLKK